VGILKGHMTINWAVSYTWQYWIMEWWYKKFSFIIYIIIIIIIILLFI